MSFDCVNGVVFERLLYKKEVGQRVGCLYPLLFLKKGKRKFRFLSPGGGKREAIILN